MAIPDGDPYRAWVYSLGREPLRSAVSASLPADAAAPPSPRDRFHAGGPVGFFLSYDGWPLKHAEGVVAVTRSAAGNPDFRCGASWEREVYGDGGRAHRGTLGDHADGPDAETAVLRLWLLAVECVFREYDSLAAAEAEAFRAKWMNLPDDFVFRPSARPPDRLCMARVGPGR